MLIQSVWFGFISLPPTLTAISIFFSTKPAHCNSQDYVFDYGFPGLVIWKTVSTRMVEYFTLRLLFFMFWSFSMHNGDAIFILGYCTKVKLTERFARKGYKTRIYFFRLIEWRNSISAIAIAKICATINRLQSIIGPSLVKRISVTSEL